MNYLATISALATSNPDNEFNPDTMTPGPEGFLFTLLVVVIVVFLGFDLVRRIRRINIRQQITEKLDAEEAEILAEVSETTEADSTETAGK